MASRTASVRRAGSTSSPPAANLSGCQCRDKGDNRRTQVSHLAHLLCLVGIRTPGVNRLGYEGLGVGRDRLGGHDSIVLAEAGELFRCSRARGTDLLRDERVFRGPVVTADPSVGMDPSAPLRPGEVDPPAVTRPHPLVDCPDQGIAVAAPLAGAVLYRAVGKVDLTGSRLQSSVVIGRPVVLACLEQLSTCITSRICG
jgi:hypothetical protein